MVCFPELSGLKIIAIMDIRWALLAEYPFFYFLTKIRALFILEYSDSLFREEGGYPVSSVWRSLLAFSPHYTDREG